MKDELAKLIQMAIELLTDCGWKEKAKWFSELKNAIKNSHLGSNELNECLTELDNVLSGMGSFSDLPLSDKTGKMSEREVKSLQWELVERLGSAIEELRKG